MKRNKKGESAGLHWYEVCGEAFFTQLILPFLDNPSREVKSLAQTCRFIYQIYCYQCDDLLWKKLLLSKYYDLEDVELEKAKGKLMMLYYQLLYFENNLHEVPEHLKSGTREQSKVNTGYPRPCFISGSSYGYYYALGFITMLAHSYFSEDNDPTIVDTYTYNLEMDDSTRKFISMFPILLNDEYPPLFDSYINTSDGMIFTLVIKEDFNTNDFSSELQSFDTFYKQLSKSSYFNSYIMTIAIYYKDYKEDSFKQIVEKELRKYMAQNYPRNFLIMECDVKNRDQVIRTTIETVKRNIIIDSKLFLKNLIQSKNKCSLM